MRYAKLNAEGDYTNWDDDKLNELKQADFPKSLGNKLLFENDRVRLWEIQLAPKERLPFRRFQNDYTWYCPTGGMSVVRDSNGGISFNVFEKEERGCVDMHEKTKIQDIQNIGFENLRMQIMEYIKGKEI